MNRVDELFKESPGSVEFADRYLGYITEVIGRVDRREIAAFIEVLLDARRRGARIFFIGNGGSAATADHFANDLAIGTRSRTLPFRAISLADNVAILTAIGNDLGFREIFTVQLKALMESGDVVIAISASGNSPNVVEAIRWAAEHGAITVGLTGFDGGAVRQIARLSVHVPTREGEYGPVEDLHMILDHLVGAYLRAACAAEKEGAP